MKNRFSLGALCLCALLAILFTSNSHSRSARGHARALNSPQKTNAIPVSLTSGAPAASRSLTNSAAVAPVSSALTNLPSSLNAPQPVAPQPFSPRRNDPGLSPEAIEQISNLQSEKKTRSPIEQRINSNLLLAVQRDAQKLESASQSVETHLQQDTSGRVLVDLRAAITPALKAEIVKGGGELVNSYPEYESLRAWVNLSQVEGLATLDEVHSICPAVRAETHSGKINSQGDAAHTANIARSSYNINGAGIKIGVLSDSVNYLTNSQSAGELNKVTVLPGLGGSGTGEGTAMLEIIHDLAPGSTLYFATADGGPAAFASNIKALRSAGCDIIVDDVGYLNESPFQDDIISQAVNKVTDNGALYFSSAGNAGNKQSNHSGTWEGDFSTGGNYSGGGTYHSFGSVTYNTVTTARQNSYAALFWSDALGHSGNDYDLYVLDSTGKTVIAKSDDYQNGNDDPIEFIDQVKSGQRLVVVLSSGSPRFLHLDTGSAELAISTSGNIRGHPCANNAFAVAAMSAQSASGGAFLGGLVNPLETFSSDGPRRMFFDPTGNPYTPGNFTATGGLVRQKPDITAADGVATSVPGFNPFYGTSAAAPHAAAIAALLKSYKTNLTSKDIRQALLASALRVTVNGVDTASGGGIVMASAALDYLTPAPAPITDNPPAITLVRTNDSLALQITGAPNAQYQIEASIDLKNWQPLPNTTTSPGTIPIQNSTTTANRFYRARIMTQSASEL
jgi:hypothetical protein